MTKHPATMRNVVLRHSGACIRKALPTLAWSSSAILILQGAAACSDGTSSAPPQLRTRWLRDQAGFSETRPAAAGDLVFFATGGGGLVARDAESGTARWSARTGGEPVRGANLAVSAGVLVVPTIHETIGFSAASGGERWRYTAPLDTVDAGPDPAPGEVVLSHVAVDQSTVYVPAWGGSVSAVDLGTGIARWIWTLGRTPGDAAENIFRSGAEGVVVSDGTVFASGWHFLDRLGLRSEPWLVALDAASGAELWRITIPSYFGGTTLSGPPLVHGDLVVIGPGGGHMWAFDRESHELAWTFESRPRQATTTGAVIFGDHLYLDVGDDHVAAVHAASGTLEWRTFIGGSVYHGLLATEKHLHVPWGQTLTVLDRASGEKLLESRQPGRSYDSFIASAPITSGGHLFVNVDGAAWSFEQP